MQRIKLKISYRTMLNNSTAMVQEDELIFLSKYYIYKNPNY